MRSAEPCKSYLRYFLYARVVLLKPFPIGVCASTTTLTSFASRPVLNRRCRLRLINEALMLITNTYIFQIGHVDQPHVTPVLPSLFLSLSTLFDVLALY